MATYNGKPYDPDNICQDDYEWLTGTGPYAEQKGKPMFGRVIYEQGTYQELLLADEENARLVLCVEGASIKLYRIEWTEADGYTFNSAQYTTLDAIAAFREAVQLQKEKSSGHAPAASIRAELISLTELRRRVVKENDLVGRLFASMRQDETPPPSWDDLKRAEAALESKVPGFTLYYVREDDMFTLAADMTYTESQKGQEKPYKCSECGKLLTFPEAFFQGNQAYCSEHLPEYRGQESEGW